MSLDTIERHASGKITSVLEKQFPPPDTYKFDAPVFDISSCKREVMQLALQLPTETIASTYKPGELDEDRLNERILALGTAFSEHEVVVSAKAAGKPYSQAKGPFELSDLARQQLAFVDCWETCFPCAAWGSIWSDCSCIFILGFHTA